MVLLFTALRQPCPPMRRMSTVASASAPMSTTLVTTGRVMGALLGVYAGALGARVIQARNGTLPDDLNGPLATLTAAKAIKKFCSPQAPAPAAAVVAPAANSSGTSHGDSSAAAVATVVPLKGEPPAGSPEALQMIASLQNICDRLGRVQEETTSRGR